MSVVSTSSTVADVLARFDAGLEAFKGLRKEIAALLKGKKTKKAKVEGEDEPKSAWVAWTALVAAKYASAYVIHLAGLPLNAKGVQPTADLMRFATKCRNELFVDDWKEHERLWSSAKTVTASASASASASAPEPADDLPKASAPAEPKAKAKAKGKAKAAKEEPSAEAAAEAVSWKNRGKLYMKNPANQVWQVGDDGVGDFVGFFDGKAILKDKLSA